MKLKYLFIFISIIFLASLLRIINLGNYPPSLNWDEVSHGFNSYSILKTGTDEWGSLPISNFRAYGDYPLSLNLYLTIPFIVVFSLSEFAIRFPHALLGIGVVIATYFLSKGLTKNNWLALLSSFLVAIDPWHLFPSRFVLQSNLSVFLISVGMAAFFNRDKNKYLASLSAFCLGLSLYSYHSTRIFTPLLLIGVGVIYSKQFIKTLKKNKFFPLISLSILLLFLVPLIFVLQNPDSRARSQVVFLLNQGATNKIIEQRQTTKLPPLVAKLLFNRPVFFVEEFSKNYVEYFSPYFLFINGGTQYQFSIPHVGLLYVISMPFFYYGLWEVLKNIFKRKKEFLVVGYWLFISPFAASITNEKFAVLRSTPMLPLPEILIAIGFCAFIQKIPSYKRAISVSFVILCFISLGIYIQNYIGNYTKNYSWAWQYGYKEVVSFVNENYSKYQKIIVTKKYGEPHEFFLFYSKWDPKSYKNDPNLNRYFQSSWYWVDRFDKIYFVNDWEIPQDKNVFLMESRKENIDCEQASSKCLLITSPGNSPVGWNKLKTIQFLNGETAFEIYEN